MNKINEEICEFLGWHIGDGCITKKRYQYALTGDIIEEYDFYKNVIIPTFNKIFKEYLRQPITIKSYKSVGVCGIYLSNKSFILHLQREFDLPAGKKTNIKIPVCIETKEQKIHFLRGLFDTDGSIYFCRSNFKTKKPSPYATFHYKPKIKLATISEELILGVYEMLLGLGFSPRLYNPRKQRENEQTIYAVVLDKTADVKKWTDEIGFRSVKHSSKIAIWKKYGFVPPKTTLQKRFKILNQDQICDKTLEHSDQKLG